MGSHAGVTAHLGGSVTTGKASPGTVIQFGTKLGLAIGPGAEVSSTFNSDGSLTIGAEGKKGIFAGADAIICTKDTTNLCVSKGNNLYEKK